MSVSSRIGCDEEKKRNEATGALLSYFVEVMRSARAWAMGRFLHMSEAGDFLGLACENGRRSGLHKEDNGGR